MINTDMVVQVNMQGAKDDLCWRNTFYVRLIKNKTKHHLKTHIKDTVRHVSLNWFELSSYIHCSAYLPEKYQTQSLPEDRFGDWSCCVDSVTLFLKVTMCPSFFCISLCLLKKYLCDLSLLCFKYMAAAVTAAACKIWERRKSNWWVWSRHRATISITMEFTWGRDGRGRGGSGREDGREVKEEQTQLIAVPEVFHYKYLNHKALSRWRMLLWLQSITNFNSCSVFIKLQSFVLV